MRKMSPAPKRQGALVLCLPPLFPVPLAQSFTSFPQTSFLGVHGRNERMFKPLSTASFSPSSHCQVAERTLLCVYLFLSHCKPSGLHWGCLPQQFKGSCNRSLQLRCPSLLFLDTWQHMTVIHIISQERSLPTDILVSSLFYVHMYMWACMHMSIAGVYVHLVNLRHLQPQALSNIFWKTSSFSKPGGSASGWAG